MCYLHIHVLLHCQCPYTIPPLAKPSNDHFSPISGPPQADLCLDKLLMHLVSLNGTLQQTPEDHNPIPSEPSSSTTSGSTPSSAQGPSSPSSTVSKSEPESTSGQSTVSMASDRQLCPCIPIRYSETFLKKLHGQPQVKVMNNLSIPLSRYQSQK